MPSLGEHCSILLPTTARSPIIQVSFMHNLTLSLFSLQALVHNSNFSRCRLSKALVHPPSYSTTARRIPSVAVQPPVSEHRPTEGKTGEDTDRAKLQNCQRPIERKNETKAIARLYFCVGNHRKTGLVSGEKIIFESISWVKQFDCLSKRDIHVWP